MGRLDIAVTNGNVAALADLATYRTGTRAGAWITGPGAVPLLGLLQSPQAAQDGRRLSLFCGLHPRGGRTLSLLAVLCSLAPVTRRVDNLLNWCEW